MQEKIIDFILKINNKYFFKKLHPFNQEKWGILNLNYSDFEYSHTEELLNMYSKVINLDNLYNKDILEIWCWAWWKSVYLAEKYLWKVTWLDINENFLSQAKLKAKEHNVLHTTNFINKSALNTELKDNSFDIIIMSDVIEHIPNTEELLEEMYRVLKKWWVILFDFAPYYHYFWHHLWDTIQIPWIHLFFTDAFLIKLYKKSVSWLIDWKQRINLRIWKRWDKEVFDYLNKITIKDFEKNISSLVNKNKELELDINYYMLRNINFFKIVPWLREILIRHIVWCIKK